LHGVFALALALGERRAGFPAHQNNPFRSIALALFCDLNRQERRPAKILTQMRKSLE